MKKTFSVFVICLLFSISSAHSLVHAKSHEHVHQDDVELSHNIIIDYDHHHDEQVHAHIDNFFYRVFRINKAFSGSAYKSIWHKFFNQNVLSKQKGKRSYIKTSFQFKKTPTTYQNIPLRI